MGAYICDKCGKDKCHHEAGYHNEGGRGICDNCWNEIHTDEITKAIEKQKELS